MRAWLLPAVLVFALLAASCGTTTTVGLAGAEQNPQASSDSTAPGWPEPTRFEAIADYSERALLSFEDAECVVDAFHGRVGSYDFHSAVGGSGVDQAALIDECTTLAPEPGPRVVVRVEKIEFTLASAPTFEDDTADGSVQLKGRSIRYLASAPPGFQPGDEAPVLIVLPASVQEMTSVSSHAGDMLNGLLAVRDQAVERGWVVVVPHTRVGNFFDKGNMSVMPELIRWISAWVAVEGGRPHLAGMDGGGEAAFAFAVQNPQAFQSLMVYPGAPDAESAADLEALSGIPVRMWVRDDDSTWLARMEQTALALEQVGADVALNIATDGRPFLIDEGHELFDQLDAAR